MGFVVEWSKANLSVWVRIHLTMKDLTENERLKYFNYGITYQQAVIVNQFDRLVINKKTYVGMQTYSYILGQVPKVKISIPASVS